ncbi:MAG: hypothetical protein LBN38_05705 [Verrucomicrobiota bacterium]|jgi:Tfp pilus assembly protein PilF|nr:hypothetical protein [Verrucomicrobiota bacterium]
MAFLDEHAGEASAPSSPNVPNRIPPRKYYRPPRDPRIPPQTTTRKHILRLVATVTGGAAIMLLLLMVAIKYAQRDWSRKNHRARYTSSSMLGAPVPQPLKDPFASSGWAYSPAPGNGNRYLRHLTRDRFIRNHWVLLAHGLAEGASPQLMLQAIRMAMAAEGDTAALRNHYGALLLQKNRIGEAEEQFRLAHRLRPGDAAVLFNLAMSTLAQNQPAQASQWLSRYLARHPEDAAAVRLQTALLSQFGEYPLALDRLERFLISQPPSQALFLEAAVLAARLGQTGKALRYLEIALNGNPIRTVARTYQSSAFRDIRLSGAGDAFATQLAAKARTVLGGPTAGEPSGGNRPIPLPPPRVR